jgi:hypothetical protein
LISGHRTSRTSNGQNHFKKIAGSKVLGQYDGGEFKVDTGAVAAEAAVECKDVRRVRGCARTLLQCCSELQVQVPVPEWQDLAVDRRKWSAVWSCLRRDTTLANRGPTVVGTVACGSPYF